MSRVLVVEDSELGVGLSANLEMEGYAVGLAVDGELGLELVRTWAPDLVATLPPITSSRVLALIWATMVSTASA